MSDSHQPWFSIGSTYWGAHQLTWKSGGCQDHHLRTWTFDDIWYLSPQPKLEWKDSNTTTSKVSILNDTHNYSIICC